MGRDGGGKKKKHEHYPITPCLSKDLHREA